MGRLVIGIFFWLFGSWSVIWWIIKLLLGRSDRDTLRLVNCFGLNDEAMLIHWERFYEERSFHSGINIVSEWNRLDAQRGQKLMGMFVWLVTFLMAIPTLVLSLLV